MKRIIIHWTAGGYFPTEHEKECYHFLVDRNGNIHDGKFKPEDNKNCNDGKYAEHTGGGNSGSIGISMCGMHGFKNKNNVGNYPITSIQFETTMKFCAELATRYNISITPQSVLTHYEFGLKNPNTSSKGKIDIIHIPPYSWVTANDVGTFIRSKIRWYKSKL